MLQFCFLHGGAKIYAIVEIDGKQYKVAPEQTIEVDHLGVAEGDAVELDKVLVIREGEKTLMGNPVIKGAKVLATSLGEAKKEKAIVFRYKAKVRYRRKRGHRQAYTKILVKEIITGQGE
ncbi:MAG: 50S ribosomal protein L21 [Dehalococcoidia bacterium]